MRADRPEGVQHISSQGYSVRVVPPELDAILDVIRDYSPNIIINDQPFIEERYLRALASVGASTINLVDTLDDVENPHGLASIVIATMQEDEADLNDYHAGPAFAILRESFRDKAKGVRSEPNGDKRRVVLTFGGADPQNLTMKALLALDDVDDLDMTVVLGPAYGYRQELEAFVAGLASKPTVLRNVEHMADILFEADLVLCSGGMTVFEIAALGRPGIVLCQNAKGEGPHGAVLPLRNDPSPGSRRRGRARDHPRPRDRASDRRRAPAADG